MAFRRQDIPKTTRAAEGEPRRLYPRYAKDAALMPRIELAIAYLDGMVGRRRGDLSPDAVIDLFGDPKLARCIVTCLSDAYRYRSPSLVEALGEEAADKLATAGMASPAAVRASVYELANAGHGGFAAANERERLLARLAESVGVSVAVLDEALHLDAERNHVLIRCGDRPRPEDVRARYNALLTLSVLRHASEVTLVLPGLDRNTVEAVCRRDEVPVRLLPDGEYRLSGRRSATGSWSQFGVRVARCALRLIVAAPRAPQGSAVVHLADRALALALDGAAVAAVRPKHRAASATGADAIEHLLEGIAVRRRDNDPAVAGWTIRRAAEPLVVADALVMPDLVCVRDEVAVPVLVDPDGAAGFGATSAISAAAAVHPLVVVGGPRLTVEGVSQVEADASALLAALDAAASGRQSGRSTLGVLAAEVSDRGWVGEERLGDLLGDGPDIAARLQPLTGRGETALVPGVGLCRADLLDELGRAAGGGGDVGSLRDLVGLRVGDGPVADALTLHLLRRARLAPPTPLYEQSALLPAG